MTPPLLEQLKPIDIDGRPMVLVRVPGIYGAYVTRDVYYKVLRRRERELEEIKKDLSRLRGLLRDLD